MIYSRLSSGLFLGADGLASWAGCYTLRGQGSAFIYSPAVVQLRIQSLSLCTCAFLPCAPDIEGNGRKGENRENEGWDGRFISVSEPVLGWCNIAGPCHSQTGASPAHKGSDISVLNLSPNTTSPYLMGRQYTRHGHTAKQLFQYQEGCIPGRMHLNDSLFFNFPL